MFVNNERKIIYFSQNRKRSFKKMLISIGNVCAFPSSCLSGVSVGGIHIYNCLLLVVEKSVVEC